jgi:iron-sulfur cluster assembly protein
MKIVIRDKAREMLANKLGPQEFLRVDIAEGGCAGLTYSAEFGQQMKGDESVVFESGNIRIVSGRDSIRYLDGLVVDYSDELIGGGLQFTNDKTGTTCGCGASFNLAGFPVAEDGKCCS